MPYGRAMEEPVPDGVTKGMLQKREVVEKLLDDYYALRGWDRNGKPTKEKLQQLDFAFAIPDIH